MKSEFLEVSGGTHGFAKTWGPSTIDWFLKGLGRHLAAEKKSGP